MGYDGQDRTVAVERPFRLSDDQVSQLSTLLGREGVRSLEIDTPRGRFRVVLSPSGEEAPGTVVRAAAVGTFLTAHPARGEPMVRPGDEVRPGDLLGFVQTGVLLSPVQFAPDDGQPATVGAVLCEPGVLVGFGTPLLALSPA